MRDILLTLIVFGSLPFILKRPYLGILVWSWLSYMNPHRLTWGFAFNFPFAQVVAITFFVALLFSKEVKRFPWSALTVVWLTLIAWMAISTIFAVQPEPALDQLIKIYKIQLITFLTLLLFADQKRLDLLIWVIVISIGFFSVKGGAFTILTGGVSRVYGPPGGFIQENNALAVATLMIIPLMLYLRRIADRIWVRHALAVAIILSVASVVGSQSRGALIAVAAVGFFFWLKTNSKLLSGVLVIAIAFAIWNFMPASWHDRMETIRNYEQDGSAMGRLNAWQYSINIAADRFTGGGLESWSQETFLIYAPNPEDVHSAHSIYFSMLADHGWPGLIMFLLILFLGWRCLGQVISVTRQSPELAGPNFLARMLQVALIAYMAGGAFLSLSYFDLPWHILAIAVLLKYIYIEQPLARGSIEAGVAVASEKVPVARP